MQDRINFNCILYKLGIFCLIFFIFSGVIFCHELFGIELEKIKIDETQAGSVFFYYNPKTSKIVLITSLNSSDIKTVNVARIRPSEQSKDVFMLEYSEGGSVDPGFIIYRIEPTGLKQLCYSISGLNIAIPGDGFFYIWGHINSEFNLKRKFIIKKDKVQEIRQPFYYVGLKTKTLTQTTIYSTKKQEIMVAEIGKGEQITVLLNSKEFYLLKTKRDIIGWWHPRKLSYFKAEEIKGIFQLGD